MFQVLSTALLVTGGLLEVAGVAFFGLDLLVGLLFVGAAVLGAAAYLFSGPARLGLVSSVIAVGAFTLHLILNLGCLSP